MSERNLEVVISAKDLASKEIKKLENNIKDTTNTIK
jgi:hypothetical protein